MDPIALHLEARNVVSLSDELARDAHALGNDDLAGHLASLRTVFGDIERELGLDHGRAVPNPVAVERATRSRFALRHRSGDAEPALAPRLDELVASLDRFVFAAVRPSEAVPAKPFARVLPLRRALPQTAHSVVDVLATTAWLASAKLARTTRGRTVGLVLGAGLAATTSATDTRLAAMRIVPIERHETADYVTAIAAVVAPVVLGYVRRDPIAAAIQIAAGIGLGVAALFTDYRATRGIGGAMRSRGARINART